MRFKALVFIARIFSDRQSPIVGFRRCRYNIRNPFTLAVLFTRLRVVPNVYFTGSKFLLKVLLLHTPAGRCTNNRVTVRVLSDCVEPPVNERVRDDWDFWISSSILPTESLEPRRRFCHRHASRAHEATRSGVNET